ncbi:MAG: flagellar type III secretion system pore protein FliP [Candidatus Rokubacteria bacterium]|nr:flagellar type III secretion system pore protein FliP [Candidatus Rokubacteria bacterium]
MRTPRHWLAAGALAVAALGVVAHAAPAGAQVVPAPDTPGTPVPGVDATADDADTGAAPDASITVDLPEVDVDGDGVPEKQPGQSVLIILLLTLLAIAPALLVMLTSFTRIVIVLSLTRNALGLTAIPPNQVVIGLSLFLSFFVMSPTLSEINEKALQPLLEGEMSYDQAYDEASAPLRTFMLDQTRRGELDLFVKASGEDAPEDRDDISMTVLVPAFVLSELKTAFIIGFVVFVPFLIIDLVVSSALMSMGMFMLPPVLVSLPFKLLLFVLVDGWGLVVESLITSFN